jgi:hypothetical protein
MGPHDAPHPCPHAPILSLEDLRRAYSQEILEKQPQLQILHNDTIPGSVDTIFQGQPMQLLP